MKSNESNKKNVSLRERMLIGVLATSLCVGGYLVFRINPQSTQKEVWQELLDDSRNERKAARPKNITKRDKSSIKQKIEQIKTEIETAKLSVTGIEGRFLESSSKLEVAKLREEITQLVSQNQLRLVGINQSSENLNNFREGGSEEISEFLRRPMFQIQLSGQYHSLLNFLSTLDSLSYDVVVAKFSITEGRASRQSGGQLAQLSFDLTLSF